MIGFLFNAAGVMAQSAIESSVPLHFVNDEGNIIQNASHLDEFFEKLFFLKSTGKNKINIVHIGDSHIQADFLTEVVRKKLQHEFGNAGRGLIIPGKVAGTNEPLNFRSSSNEAWVSKRCVHPAEPLPIGIGGVTIAIDKTDAKLSIQMSDPSYDYSFNTLTLFFQKDIDSFDFLVQDSALQQLGIISAENESADHRSTLIFPLAYNTLSIQTLNRTKRGKHATIFGMNLENGNEGILYHAIGVNGAKYVHYNAAALFAEQTKALQPDLFIISLGTNESADYPYVDKNFPQHIARLVQSLNEYNPLAKFMFITPPDAFRKKIKHNPGIEAVREQLLLFAVEHGFAFWDMFMVNGGKNSATQWKTNGLLRPDGIHFTKEGYAYQGDLLYQAIMKSYNQYVTNRQP